MIKIKSIFIKKSYLILIIAIMLLLIFVISFTYGTDNKVCDEELYKLYKQKKLIMLTFDDGPSKYTQYLSEELTKRNAKATFFVLGQNIDKHDILNEVNKNHEIGMHGYDHKLFTRLKNEQIQNQIDITNNKIFEKTNKKTSLIRVPYGSVSIRVNNMLKKNELTSILWTVDSKDWSYRNTDKTYNHVIKKIQGNDIILMHDIYETSIKTALKLVDELTNKGYKFITVSEYLAIK
ncbi:MAG: polysaccharide deacetylase family protein [Clostridia bacterium]